MCFAYYSVTLKEYIKNNKKGAFFKENSKALLQQQYRTKRDNRLPGLPEVEEC